MSEEETTTTEETGEDQSEAEAPTPETEAPTPEIKSNPVKFYYGQVFYNEQGQVLEEVGEFNNIDASKQKVKKCRDHLKGTWAFALVRTMTKLHPHSPQVWANAVLFPDETHRRVSGQDSADAATTDHEGTWLGIEQMNAAYDKIRMVPQTIMPYSDQTMYLQKVRFADLAALREHFKGVETEVLFCQTRELPPKEAGLYAYIAICSK